MHKTCERTHAKMGAQVHYSTEQHHLLASQEPGITEIKHPGTADTAHRRAQASLQGRNRQKCIHKARACAQPNTAAPCTHPAKPHHQPGIMQKPGIPAQQMERTGTRASGCRSGTGQNPLLEHAHTAPQPRSVAWEGGGEAAAHLGFARELLDTFQQRELRCRYFLLVRSLGVALEPPNRSRRTPPTQRSTPTCLPNPSRKKNRPLSGRPPTAPFVGGAPPPPMWATPHRLRRGRIDEMDTSRKPSTRPERRPSLQALR